MGHLLHILLKSWIIVFVIVIQFYHLLLELLLGSARASEQVLHFKKSRPNEVRHRPLHGSCLLRVTVTYSRPEIELQDSSPE